MKKLLGIVILGLVLFATSANALKAKKTKLKRGQVYEGNIVYNDGINIDLPDGKWIMVDRWFWEVESVFARGVTFVMLEDNVLKGLIEISQVDAAGMWTAQINDWLRSAYTVNKTDGCYKKSEYYLVERYKAGPSFNCLVIRHFDVQKEIHNPDKDLYKYHAFKQSYLKFWFRKKNITLPLTMLGSEHAFYAPSVGQKVNIITYIINPELYGAPKTEFGTEQSSEYHQENINRYPNKKKFMENWVKIAVQRHKNFEKEVKAKKHHLLDLNKYISSNSSIENKSDVVDNLKKLNDLYKSGVLTKEEFEKAKKKILN